MTQPSSAPRCQVWDWLRSGGTCNLPLVPTEGPCVICGAPNPLFLAHAYDEGEPVPGWRSVKGHPYQPTLACPIHGAPDRGDV